MSARRVVVGLLACLALAGCGESAAGGASPSAPFELPVGPTEWEADAPAWLHDGVLHVGDREVELGDRVTTFVLGPTGAYWISGQLLMFTSAEGETQEVRDLQSTSVAISPDRSTLAILDGSHGPTDDYGTHVLQVVAFDTRTGEQLYRSPDEEPEGDPDLADLYEETSPHVEVSDEHVFFEGTVIDLADGTVTKEDESHAETLTRYGYPVVLEGTGRHREVVEFSRRGNGMLSPDRSTIFDMQAMWPAGAVVYDADTGAQAELDAPWDHFVLAGWSDEDTFLGIAQRVQPDGAGPTRANQVATCELRGLACTPASPVLPVQDEAGGYHFVLVEGSSQPY